MSNFHGANHVRMAPMDFGDLLDFSTPEERQREVSANPSPVFDAYLQPGLQYLDPQLNGVACWAYDSTNAYTQGTNPSYQSAVNPQSQPWSDPDLAFDGAYQPSMPQAVRNSDALTAQKPKPKVRQGPSAPVSQHRDSVKSSAHQVSQQQPIPTQFFDYAPPRMNPGAVKNAPVEAPPAPAARSRPADARKSPPPTKPVQPETERYIAGTLADYDSLLFRKPEVVMSWFDLPFNYTNEHITFILQHFVHVSQIKGQARVDEILQLRQPHIIAQQLWHSLDPLDPIRMCPPGYNRPRGVPIVGTILGGQVGQDTNEPIEGNRPDINNDDQTVKMNKGERTYQLRGPYRWHWQCLPIGTTCWQILQQYPNHTMHEFLDDFLQHRMHPTDMWDSFEASIQGRFRQQNVIQTDQGGNIFTKRIYRRMLTLIEKAGGDHKKVEAFLNSPIKLRALGGNLRGRDTTNRDVWHVKKKWEKGVQRWNEYQAMLQAEGQQSSARGSSSAPSTGITPSSSITPRSSATPTTTPAVSSPVAAAVVEPAGPSAVHSAGPAAQAPSRSAPAGAAISDAQHPATSGETPSSAERTQASASKPTEIRFSTLASQHGLGHFQGRQFWNSKREYVQHVQAILFQNMTQRQLLDVIVEHDMHMVAEPKLEVKQSKRDQALFYLFQKDVDATYQARGYDIEMPKTGRMDVESVIRQLDAEVGVAIHENVQLKLDVSQASDLVRIKDEALSRQVTFHKTITQVLAVTVSTLLVGYRRGAFDTATDDAWLGYAHKLVNATEEALEAQAFGSASVRQRFFYQQELKNAIANFVADQAQKRDGAMTNDLNFLLAMRDETKASQQAMENSDLTDEGRVISLSPRLRHLAASLYDELLAQIAEELAQLRIRQARRGVVAGKRGAVTVAAHDQDTTEQNRPTKRRGRPKGSVNKAKARDESQPTNTTSGEQPKRQVTNQVEAQHPAHVQELANTIAQPQSLDAGFPEKPNTDSEQVQEDSRPEPILKTASALPTEAAFPLVDSVLQEPNHQPLFQQAFTATTHDVHSDRDVLGAGKAFSQSAQSVPEATVHDEAVVSGDGVTSSNVPMDKGKKRAREEDDDVAAEQPSPKSPRLELPDPELPAIPEQAQPPASVNPQQASQELIGQYGAEVAQNQNDQGFPDIPDFSDINWDADINWDGFDIDFGQAMPTDSNNLQVAPNDIDVNFGYDFSAAGSSGNIPTQSPMAQNNLPESYGPQTYDPEADETSRIT